jgi:hypothetical protein
MGLEPQLGHCATCGLAAGERAGSLDVRAGAYRCRACPGGEGRLLLPAEAARLLAAAASGSAEEVAQLESTPRSRRLVGIALHRLLATHLERYRYPRSLALLKKVDGRVDDDRAAGPPPGFPTIA